MNNNAYWLEVRGTPWIGIGEKGLYTRVNCPEDELLSEIPGRIIVSDTYTSSTCIMYGESRVMIEPFEPLTFMNHCCSPSCYFDTFERDGKQILGLFAGQDLKPGDEVTVDYDWNCDPPLKCKCGHAECRGVV